MKIALTTREKSLESELDLRFARGNFILFYNTEDNSYEFIDNQADDAHGAGPKMIEFLVRSGANSIIARSLGKNAYDAANSAGIKIYENSSETAIKNIELLKNNKLKEMNSFSNGHKGF